MSNYEVIWWSPLDFGFERIADLPRYKNGKYRLFKHPNNIWVLVKHSTNKYGEFEAVTTFYLQIYPWDVQTAVLVFNTIREIELTQEGEKKFASLLKNLDIYEYSKTNFTQDSD